MKPIKLTDDVKAAILDKFAKQLSTVVRASTITFTHTPTVASTPLGKDEKVLITYTAEAFRKQQMLIQSFDSEVAWHGVVEREDAKHFIITDIVVYPQTVTGSTVEMDEDKYALWTIQFGREQGEETFQKLRMQGHSHVNMECFASGTDAKHQDDILATTDPNGFYIFIIANKKGKFWSTIFDLEANVQYENADIEIEYEEDEYDEFVSAAESVVVKKTYTPPYSYGSGYHSNGAGYSYGASAYSQKPPQTPPMPVLPTNTQSKTNTNETNTKANTSTKKDDKAIEEDITNLIQMSLNDMEWDEVGGWTSKM